MWCCCSLPFLLPSDQRPLTICVLPNQSHRTRYVHTHIYHQDLIHDPIFNKLLFGMVHLTVSSFRARITGGEKQAVFNGSDEAVRQNTSCACAKGTWAVSGLHSTGSLAVDFLSFLEPSLYSVFDRWACCFRHGFAGQLNRRASHYVESVGSRKTRTHMKTMSEMLKLLWFGSAQFNSVQFLRMIRIYVSDYNQLILKTQDVPCCRTDASCPSTSYLVVDK
ncbi:hypothetical protein An17g01895 [Aspergillus niger]|uniref:Uncharacterized protein n=3 Tax=Aspergillus niger TaxID=5061 RepID=A2R9L9_ASPNC|nr:hypothetical protein An17g01895 [Aspergillus niger]CAK49146.1 hypothetical protein An17g01895 [Aspergillus niger]